jgi:hypothetical protein
MQYRVVLRAAELHSFWREREKLYTYWRYSEGLPSAKSNCESVEMVRQAGQERDRKMELGWNVLKVTVHLQPNLRSSCRNEWRDEREERKVTKFRKIQL